MPIRQFLNRTDFTDPDSALDLYGNSLRTSFSYDAYQGKTVFEAIVLTRPIFLVDAHLKPDEDGAEPKFETQNTRETGRLDKFMFRARILADDAPSPHDYLPDPCDIQIAEQYTDISKLYNLHTIFISSDDYTRTNSTLPKVGDIVKVELFGNVHSFNLQHGSFLSIKSSGNGALPSKTADGEGDSDSQWNCRTARSLFSESDFLGSIPPGLSETEQRTLAKQYLTRMRQDAGEETYSISLTKEFAERFSSIKPEKGLEVDEFYFGNDIKQWETIQKFAALANTGYYTGILDDEDTWSVPIYKKYFITGTDSRKITYDPLFCGPWRTNNKHYPPAKCEDCYINGASTKLHPTFCRYIKNAIEAAGKAVPGSEMRFSPNIRTTETQIYLRIRYNCGQDYNGIISNASSKCSVQAAKPGYSNHEIGLAVDIGGTLTQGGTKAAKVKEPPSAARKSSLFGWMMQNVHNKSRLPGTKAPTDGSEDTGILGNILNYHQEPWHWSYNGG